MAIYSKENSQGMSFPLQIPQATEEKATQEKPTESKDSTKSHIKLVK
jgi:stringent starvation protein B